MIRSLIITASQATTGEKVAIEIAQKLNGTVDVEDAYKSLKHIIISPFNNIIFHSNVRMGMLNRKFKKAAKKYRKSFKDKNIYGFITGLNESKKDVYIKKMHKYLGDKAHIYFIGGEIQVESAKGNFAKKVYESQMQTIKDGKLAMPHVNQKVIDTMIKDINANGEKYE